MDRVISELCCKETLLQKNYRKMTIYGHFPYNSFVKLHGKNIWEPQNDSAISKSVLYRGVL